MECTVNQVTLWSRVDARLLCQIGDVAILKMLA
jgi:hypothetical protein